MLKSFLLITLYLFMFIDCSAQSDKSSPSEFFELHHQLFKATNDTSRVLILADMSYIYAYENFDSSLFYGQQALKQSEEIHFTRGKVNALLGLGNLYLRQGDYPEGLQYQLQALQLSEENKFEREQAIALLELGYTYQNLSDYTRALDFLQRSKKIYQRIPFDPFKKVENEIGISNAYIATNQKNAALECMLKLYNDPQSHNMLHVVAQVLGDVYASLHNYAAASTHLYLAIELDIKKNDLYSLIWACNSMAKLYQELKQTDSCIHYAKRGFLLAQEIKLQEGILINSLILSKQYELINAAEALYYRKAYDDANTKVYGPDKVLALQKTLAAEQERQRNLETERVAEKNKRLQYLFAGGIVVLGLIAFLLYRNNLQQKKAKKIVEDKNKIIEQTLVNLRSTQTQLIQSEKMASLGELTAGIAHEIQNPLNFVNNFSEVNKELLVELKAEADKGNLKEVKELANDVIGNEEKINHHGKRADAIVKGMLQHSRTSTGQKEPTDINALADEYLRLAYHGLRAKDKTFNAILKTNYDESIGNINIIPQDIGRVILNLITNAFYAMNEKKKSGTENYEPVVTITTKRVGSPSGDGGKVQISVADNGQGIPQNIIDKIFQPFFTTKPTGQGTGLGLSLAYDIINAHGGEIKVETEGTGTTFITQLPLT